MGRKEDDGPPDEKSRAGEAQGAPPGTRPPAAPEREAAIIPLSRYRAALARARKQRRADVILEDPEMAKLVPSLPVQELFHAIKEVGIRDAGEILALATPEQYRGFLDLDAWDRDRFSVDRTREWLEAVVDCGPDKLGQVISGLDAEFVALYLIGQLRVYDLQLDLPPDEPEGNYYPTPDTFFLLDVVARGEAAKKIEHLVDWLYRADIDLARRVLMEARAGLPSDLEEWAFRWRSGRMADLGFVDYHEALAVYRYLDPASVKVGEGTAETAPAVGSAEHVTLPSELTSTLEGGSFFGRALSTVTDPAELDRIFSATLMLVNQVMAADRVDPGDLEGARLALERASAYLCLGLETIGRGDVDRAAQALGSIALTRIFRVGVSLTLKLKRAAEALDKSHFISLIGERGPLPGKPTLLDAPLADTLVALRHPRPLLARALVDARPDRPLDGERHFRTLADVARVAAALEEMAEQSDAVRNGLGVDPRLLDPAHLAGCVPSPDRVTFSTIVATLCANLLLERPPLLVPLSPADLPSLRTIALEDNALRPSARLKLTRELAARFVEREVPEPAAWDRWLAEWLSRFEESLRLSADLSPEKLSGFLIRLDTRR